MIGGFLNYTIALYFGFGSIGFCVGLSVATLLVALISIDFELGILRTLYVR